jgi:hypothetical protein
MDILEDLLIAIGLVEAGHMIDELTCHAGMLRAET